MSSDKITRIGPEYQAAMPSVTSAQTSEADFSPSLMWRPSAVLSESTIDAYIALGKRKGFGEEQALSLLQKSNYDLRRSLLVLLDPNQEGLPWETNSIQRTADDVMKNLDRTFPSTQDSDFLCRICGVYKVMQTPSHSFLCGRCYNRWIKPQVQHCHLSAQIRTLLTYLKQEKDRPSAGAGSGLGTELKSRKTKIACLHKRSNNHTTKTKTNIKALPSTRLQSSGPRSSSAHCASGKATEDNRSHQMYRQPKRLPYFLRKRIPLEYKSMLSNSSKYYKTYSSSKSTPSSLSNGSKLSKTQTISDVTLTSTRNDTPGSSLASNPKCYALRSNKCWSPAMCKANTGRASLRSNKSRPPATCDTTLTSMKTNKHNQSLVRKGKRTKTRSNKPRRSANSDTNSPIDRAAKANSADCDQLEPSKTHNITLTAMECYCLQFHSEISNTVPPDLDINRDHIIRSYKREDERLKKLRGLLAPTYECKDA